MGTYRYNPDCRCDWCANDGKAPTGTPENGHSFGYGSEHKPPALHRLRIIALLSWYDEEPEWLTRAITSLAKVPVDHLVALDGPYDLYGGPDKSSADQYDAIRKACAEAGIGLEIHVGGWDGNEVEKRNHLFELAEQAANPGDWYMVFDADEFVTAAPTDVHRRLATTPFHVGAITLNEPGHPFGTIRFDTFPMFFRAIPGLRCVADHFTYTTPDGLKLWGDAKRARLEARADLTAVKVEHHAQLRHPDRREKAMAYYRTRDELGIEALPTERYLTA